MFEPGVIVGQMQLRNFIMLKVFLTAVATGAVVLAALNGFGLVKLQPKAALYAADIVGGLILGVGIALAGACPGTTLAQVGVGYRDALFTLVGGLCGALAFSYLQPMLATTFLASGDGKITFTDLLGIPYWTARWRSRPSWSSRSLRSSAGGRGARRSAAMSMAILVRPPRRRLARRDLCPPNRPEVASAIVKICALPELLSQCSVGPLFSRAFSATFTAGPRHE